MDPRQAIEFAAQNAADARYLLTDYPDEILRIVNKAQGAAHWAVDAWLTARNIDERGRGWSGIIARFANEAGKEAGGLALRLHSRLFWLEQDWMSGEPRAEPLDPGRWRAEMDEVLRAVEEFVAVIAAEIAMPIAQDETPS